MPTLIEVEGFEDGVDDNGSDGRTLKYDLPDIAAIRAASTMSISPQPRGRDMTVS